MDLQSKMIGSQWIPWTQTHVSRQLDLILPLRYSTVRSPREIVRKLFLNFEISTPTAFSNSHPKVYHEAMSPSSGEINELRTLLARFPVWDRIPTPILDELCNCTQTITVAHRRPLFLDDKPSSGIYVVKRGEFKVTLISSEGREQILYLADRGKMIIEAFLPSGGPNHCSAFSRDESEAWELASPNLCRLMSRSPELATAVAESMAFRSNRHIDLVFALSLRSVERRLAAFILELARRAHAEPGRTFVLPREINVSTVACLLGTVREEVTRAQTRLQKKGLVQISRHQVVVHDIDALEALVNE